MSSENKRVFLKSRPGADHEPTSDNFGCENCDMPSAETLQDGEVIIKTLYLSLDPAMIDEALHGNPQVVLSLLGLSGLTSYLGVKVKGHVTPGTNQTFVVSGAAGSCGNLAGQIAKLLGATKVVGICGSDVKCEFLKSQLNFDATINYKTKNVPDRLRELCPDGINSYFDNVGGSLSENVIRQMTQDSHVILCGQIAMYNKDVPYPPPISEEIQSIIKEKNITRERFLVLNYQDQFTDSIKQLQEWFLSGQLKAPEYIHEGIETASTAFVNMMTSVNQEKVGKQMVRVCT